MTKRICLWSCPRNLSTALMYSFAQRTDTKVFDEPLYAYYLEKSGVDHPGRDEVLANMETNPYRVIEDVILGDHGKDVLFFKLMTHFLIDLDESFMDHTMNVIYIRHPALIINSYAKVRPQPNMDDIGVQAQRLLFERLTRRRKMTALLDSETLLKNPAATLSALCEKIGIEYQDSMLSWEAGGREEDGIWAKYWYGNLHTSTGFQPWTEKSKAVAPENQALLDECIPYYEFLRGNALGV